MRMEAAVIFRDMDSHLDEEIAERLVESFQRIRAELDRAEEITREIDDEEIRMKFGKIIGHISLDVYYQAMGQVFQFHHRLDPLGIFDPERDRWEKE